MLGWFGDELGGTEECSRVTDAMTEAGSFGCVGSSWEVAIFEVIWFLWVSRK